MHTKKRTIVLMILSIMVCLLYTWNETAEARRFGGSRSFGSKPAYKRSAPAPAKTPAPTQVAPGRTAPGQKPVAGAASPLGRFGGIGGMMGGMLMGGLIGSMLFGGGAGGVGGGPGLLDILLIGGGLYFLFRFLRARKMAMASQSASPSAAGPIPYERGAAQGWGAVGYAGTESPVEAEQAAYPPGFNAEEFLKGANIMYTRLQAAWDKRDLSDIRQFTTPEVFSEIEGQAKEDPAPGKTELLLVTPQIIEVREIDGQTVATVLFDVMMREDGDNLAKQVRELWHFGRDTDKLDTFWMLEGIQQVE